MADDLGELTPRGEAPPPRKRRWRRIGLVLAALAVLVLAWEALTWPDVAALAREDPETTAFIERYEAREREAGREPRTAWTPVPLSLISRNLQLAVLVAEDDRFFEHEGFATEELKKALRDHLEKDKPMRGASTITQQLAKNLWLTPSRNPLRKVREALLTLQMERTLEKQRILELYVNTCEFGPGVYGAEAAAGRFFGKAAAGLTADESAQLAASLTRPSTWHPGVTSSGYRRRVALIRDRMERWPWTLP